MSTQKVNDRLLELSRDVQRQMSLLIERGMYPGRITMSTEAYDDIYDLSKGFGEIVLDSVKIHMNTPYGRFEVERDEMQSMPILVYPNFDNVS